ncbi:hypothetical protein KDW_57680 [Dictyobacter vulcani]|uniref:3'-phosphate/5'-hydroxy nucleic acid ligase n=1 Tax=Dictyobacter vulcani TaxID=2607529 RepID=A0A5J4L2C2_9CHLR|nr:hypothetical protein KDW_57680 [Dictyobacter vulcani]
MVQGAKWAVDEGYGFAEDIDMTEERGCLEGADPSAVSKHAIQRGRKQLGSLGSGNHFCEVQMVDHIYNQDAADAMGIGRKGQIVVTLHCGSREWDIKWPKTTSS